MVSEIPPKLDEVTTRNIKEMSNVQPTAAFDPTPYQMEIDSRLQNKYQGLLDRMKFESEQKQKSSQFQNIVTAIGFQNAKAKYNMQRADIIRKRKMAEDAQRAQLIGSILGLGGAAAGAYLGSSGGAQGAFMGASAGSQIGQSSGSMFSNSNFGG